MTSGSSYRANLVKIMVYIVYDYVILDSYKMSSPFLMV